MKRRDFLKTTALGAGALALSGLASPAGAQAAGPRVSLVRNAALENLEGEPLAQQLRMMTFVAIADAVGASSIQAAMQSLFKPTDIVAIKLNAIAPEIAPQSPLVFALVEALGLAGVPAKNVIIFDKEDRDLAAAGYSCTATGDGPMIYGTVGATKDLGYEQELTEQNKTGYCLSKIVTREATAIINVPIIKQHCFAGMTGALKNHFGCIHNPEDFHYIDGCNPAVADVNLDKAIRKKQRLCVVDGVWVQYDHGPAFSAEHVDFYGGVLAATDPVALDTHLIAILDQIRKQHDLPPLAECKNPPKYVKTAAEYGLGCGDLSAINLVAREL
jgi:uncharacterized protein (DUF362 family)